MDTSDIDEKLAKQLAIIERGDKLVPEMPAEIDDIKSRWSRDELNTFAKTLFNDGYVVIPQFVPAVQCDEVAGSLVARVTESGALAKTRELQRSKSTQRPDTDDLDGSRIAYRASESKGTSYDTGMLMIHGPEMAVPKLLALKDDPVTGAIVAAAKNGPMEYKGQVVYFNDSVTNPRGLHWDSVTMQFKAFLYLSDVNDEADGPYSYVRGSHLAIKSRAENVRNNLDNGHLASDAFIYEEADLKRLLGKKGTLIISNQRGYHGGTPQQVGHRRIMLVQNYI